MTADNRATIRPHRVDQTGLKVGQALTIILCLAAFIFNLPIIVAFVALAQLFGALDLPFAPYRLFYRALQPTGILKPNILTDNPEPHRFAMLVGAMVNGLGFAALTLNAPVVGWALVWVVIALANLNFWLNFCAGCWMYYLLHRAGVPGFIQSPVTG